MRTTSTYKTALEHVTTYQKILRSLSELDALVQDLKGVNSSVTELLEPYRSDVRRQASRLAEAM